MARRRREGYVRRTATGHRCGEGHHRAKLSDLEVMLIRQIHEEGYSYADIAGTFGVSPSTVRHIVKGRRRCY